MVFHANLVDFIGNGPERNVTRTTIVGVLIVSETNTAIFKIKNISITIRASISVKRSNFGRGIYGLNFPFCVKLIVAISET